MPIPVSSGVVTYGGAGYVDVVPKLSTGGNAAITVPVRVSKIGPLKFSYTASNGSDNDIKAATNRPGEEITAIPAFSISSSSNDHIECTVSFSFLESSVEHWEWYRYVRTTGYFAIGLPLGVHDGDYLNYFGFGVFDDGGEINVDGDKPTEITCTFKTKKNTAACTFAAPVSVTDYGATFTFPATIAIGFGEEIGTVAA